MLCKELKLTLPLLKLSMPFNNLKVFGLIPARGGSKGIKNKNMVNINGRPLIDFTIDASRNSQYVDKTFLSSDSKTILAHGKNRNISVVERPHEYANDESSAVQVVFHFHDFLMANGVVAEGEDYYLTYLQPTSPLRTAEILDESFKILEKSSEDSVISLVENEYTPYKSFLLNDEGLVESLFEESLSNQNRQKLKKTYRANGAIYTFLISKFIQNNGFPSNFSQPFIMKSDESLDIDSYDDLDVLKSKFY